MATTLESMALEPKFLKLSSIIEINLTTEKNPTISVIQDNEHKNIENTIYSSAHFISKNTEHKQNIIVPKHWYCYQKARRRHVESKI